ncbi:hypothetical protein [Ilumatobacter nonamiensis]|uniref:hypothetical protein n=1 Tax=Ilumatobacter nonamiensis TaxID=467093 RepID=UPI00034D8609|nr:hypothetical protein [Ilumatobacter nonamiensis]
MRLTTRNRDLDVSSRSGAAVDWWSLIVAVVVTVSIGLMLPAEPDRVTVTIDNPSDHRLYINASTPDDASLSFVTIVGPRATKSMPDVIDRGSTWVLHLRTAGAPAGTVEVSRADLVNGSAVIPSTIDDDLAAAGVPADVNDPEDVP